MAIRIPKYDQQIGAETVNLPEVPHISAVEGAFGGDVARANQAIGQAIGDVAQVAHKQAVREREIMAKHMEEQRKLQNDAFVASQEENYRSEINDRLYNTDTEKRLINGQNVEIPKGIMNRQGLNAQGSIGDLREWQRTTEQKYIQNIKDPEVRYRVQESIRKRYLDAEDKVFSYEAKNVREGNIDRIKSNVDLKIQDSYGIMDVDTLRQAINDVAVEQNKVNQFSGVDGNTAQKNLRDSVKKTVQNSAISALQRDPTGTESMKLLDGVSGIIHPEDYDAIKEKIITGKSQNERFAQSIIIEQRIKDRFDYISKVIEGKIDWKNSDDIVREIAPKDPDLAQAVQNIVQGGGKYLPSENIIQNMATMDVIKKVLDSPDRQQVSQYLINFLKGNNGGNIGVDKLSLIMSVAKEHADSMSDNATPEQKNKVNLIKGVFNFIKEFATTYSPNATVRFLNEVYKNNMDGKKIIKAGHDAIRQEVIDNHPIVGSLPVVPHKIIYDDGGADDIYNGNTEIRSYGDNEDTADRSSSNEF